MNAPGLIPCRERFSAIVAHVQEPMRLDRYLTEQFPLYSRSFFKRIIEGGCVSINTASIRKQGTLLKSGDVVEVQFPDEHVVAAAIVHEQTRAIEVLYTHDHFLIINKPAGIAVHKPNIHYPHPTVVDWIMLNHQEIVHVGYVDRPGIVHRLDKDTSGLMIIARTQYAHTVLCEQFKQRVVHKTYLAFVQGHPPRQGSIDFMIGRHPVHRNKMSAFTSAFLANGVERDDKLRDALTHYTVLDYFDDTARVEVKPVTGRTHQIRVHFSALGYPLVGDLLYGAKSSQSIARHALHAYEVAFSFEGTPYAFVSQPPADLNLLIKKNNFQTP